MLGDTLRRATRNAHLWLPGYLRSRWARRKARPPSHVWLTIADHFEPLWQRPSMETALARVQAWRQQWPQIAARHRDATGRSPRYTFFYPQEEYRPELVEPLAELTRAGIADVEIHLHHDGEGEQDFVERMGRFIEVLSGQHGLLRKHEGRIVFGFIHGNWALDNARPDGRWCGLNNEITLLHRLGCYADFTMPAAPDSSQAGPVNAIYRVLDDPNQPRSHAHGLLVGEGTSAVGDLTLIPGPLALDFQGRAPWKPRIDTGELASYHPPSLERARLWLGAAPRIGDHAFLKLFSHGAQEGNQAALLNGDLDVVHASLRAACKESGAALHFVTAFEMWRALEALRTGDGPVEAGVRPTSLAAGTPGASSH